MKEWEKAIRTTIGTVTLLSMNYLGLFLYMFSKSLTLKIIGWFDFAFTIIIFYLIVYQYFESSFYKSLGENK